MIEKFKSSFVKNDEGVTILEMLFVVALIGVLSISLVDLSRVWAERQKYEQIAVHFSTLYAATQAYIVDNFAVLEAATGAAPVTISIENPGGGGFYLKDGGTYLPSNFNNENLFGQGIEVLLRRISATELQAIIVTTGRAVDVLELVEVAETIGVTSGLVVGQDLGGYDDTAFSGYGASWSVPLASYTATGWETSNPVTAGTAHLAGLLTVNASEDLGEFLYRVDITGDAEANRMFVDLDVNNNSLVNTGNVSADFSSIAGSLTFDATIFDVSAGLAVEGNITTDILDVGSLPKILAEPGNLDVQSANVTSDVTILGDVALTGQLIGRGSNITDPNNTRLQANRAFVNNSVTANRLASQNLDFSSGGTQSVIVDNNLAGVVNVGNISNVLTVQTPALGATNLQNISDFNLSGSDFTVNGPATFTGTVSAGSISSDNVSISNLSNCVTTTNSNCN